MGIHAFVECQHWGSHSKLNKTSMCYTFNEGQLSVDDPGWIQIRGRTMWDDNLSSSVWAR